MENWEIIEITSDQIKEEAEKTGRRALKSFWVVFIITGVVIGALFAVFFWERGEWFKWDAPVDNGLLGTLGDFIGGVIGTGVAFYSIYLLVKTFQNQIDSNADMKVTNESVIKTNKSVIESNSRIIELDEIQLFDNKFQVFFSQYKDAIASYDATGKAGRQALEEKASKFLAKNFTSNLVYKKKVQAAVRVFEEFYAENRMACSAHFRELYLLVRLVAEQPISNHDRALYAKCVRGQLSEGETILLRYNCLTDNGKAMCRFVNHFNLLKHLPLMSLFEFRKWAKLIPNKHEQSALDTAFIALRKMMKDANDSDQAIELLPYEMSTRYVVWMSYDEGHTCLIFRLEEDKKHKGAAGVARPFIEKALDNLGSGQMSELFYSFLHETFITSNFGLYGNPPNCVHSPIIVTDDANELVFEIQVKGGRKLVLSENQLYPA